MKAAELHASTLAPDRPTSQVNCHVNLAFNHKIDKHRTIGSFVCCWEAGQVAQTAAAVAAAVHDETLYHSQSTSKAHIHPPKPPGAVHSHAACQPSTQPNLFHPGITADNSTCAERRSGEHAFMSELCMKSNHYPKNARQLSISVHRHLQMQLKHTVPVCRPNEHADPYLSSHVDQCMPCFLRDSQAKGLKT